MQFICVMAILATYAVLFRWLAKYLFHGRRTLDRVTNYAVDVLRREKRRSPSRAAELDQKIRVLRDWSGNFKS